MSKPKLYPKMVVELRLEGKHAGYVQCKDRFTLNRHYVMTTDKAEAYGFFDPVMFIKLQFYVHQHYHRHTAHLIRLDNGEELL